MSKPQTTPDSPLLLLHGFTSHISAIEAPAASLRQAGFYVETPILRGHGTTWRALRGVGSREWYEDAEAALLQLYAKCNRQIALGGFSMGGLVAMELAMNHPEKIYALGLAAPALRFADPLAPAAPLLAKVIKVWPGPNSFNDAAAKRARNKNYPLFPMESFVSLYHYARHIESMLARLTTPLFILHSLKDGVISHKSARIIAHRSASTEKELCYLNRSGHELFLDMEMQRATELYTNYFKGKKR